MSPRAGEGSEAPTEETHGLRRMVSRMRLALRKSKSASRLSLSSKPANNSSRLSLSKAAIPATASASVEQREPIPPVPAPPPMIEAPVEATVEAPVEKPVEKPVEQTVAPEGPPPTRLLRSQMQIERARKLVERFDLNLSTDDFISVSLDREAFRVEKPIRMRIHRTCHKCNTMFGGNKKCVTCQHKRCSKCPRYPPLKTDDAAQEKERLEELLAPDENVTDDYQSLQSLREQMVWTRPRRTSGQPLVKKKPVQRVRRTCHVCLTLFNTGSYVCANCQHRRCADCPRDPRKKSKYPDGYPGDMPSSTSTAPIKYACHECGRTFAPVPHPNSPEGEALGDRIEPLECTRCGHFRCADCPRAQPRKVDRADREAARNANKDLTAFRLNLLLDHDSESACSDAEAASWQTPNQPGG